MKTAALASRAVLAHPPSDFIGGRFVPLTGDRMTSRDPADPARIIWQGSPQRSHVDDAVEAARRALPAWASLSFEERVEYMKRWKAVTGANAERIAGLITDEMGKTLAESLMEARALGDKVDITLEENSIGRVRVQKVPVSATREGVCRFKPHGVMAVISPFNFPAHLANGHFVPALLMGNTVIVKPSDKTPAVGQLLGELMQEAGLPSGVFNVVQGDAVNGTALTTHPDIDGILFTGSWAVGRSILEANLDRPGRIVALEMGGNNPTVVLPDAPKKLTIVECVRASFATTGQRCTCTRRLIVHKDAAEWFIPAFCKAASMLMIGPGKSKEPVFMGPAASEHSVQAVLEFEHELVRDGGRALVESSRLEGPGYFISPGVVEVDGFSLDRDTEVFGPLVQCAIVSSLDEAIEQSNMTQYGLAAAIFTTDREAYGEFFARVRCGCINFNNGTAGASSKLPFGGVGKSGNHRPAGTFSVDYCAYPVASLVETATDIAVPAGVHFDDRWLQ
jgi:succinylglutamic semialdehyde dehydrogenase